EGEVEREAVDHAKPLGIRQPRKQQARQVIARGVTNAYAFARRAAGTALPAAAGPAPRRARCRSRQWRLSPDASFLLTTPLAESIEWTRLGGASTYGSPG